MEGVIVGRIVHYVMEDGFYVGEERPAIIVKVWGDPKATERPCVQLAVLVDGTNDYHDLPVAPGGFMPVLWKTSRMYSEGKEPWTWHFPEQD